MEAEYRKAFTEIYEIFNLMPQEIIDKIPKKFYQMIEEEKDKSYKPNIKEPLEEQKLKNETIVLLGLIYRDFLCSQEEKKLLKEKDAGELQKTKEFLEAELKEKYNVNNIFNAKNNNRIEEQTQVEQKNNELIVVQKEKWYRKIISIIKKLFKR